MCHETKSEKPHVTVIVLGDFGRSPRMQYHTLSLSKRNFIVDVVAYKGSEPLEEINRNQGIHLHYMHDVPQFFSCFPGILRYILKAFWQSFLLFLTLIRISKIHCILLQNPPSIPTLPVACFVCWVRKCHLIIDFHNYGYTILALSAGKESTIVKVAKWCEMYFSCKADKSICVTQAMREDLNENWHVKASVFYDCPPDVFHPISVEEKHSLFMKLSEDYEQFKAKFIDAEADESTRFTKRLGDSFMLLTERPALIVSSTSWTEDEDFTVLLSALEDYEQAAKLNKNLPNLLVAITGKGPLKSFYEEQIKDKGFSYVEILTLWLKFEDYPTFLACADLGVSLHSSSSGLDLPMKVVDMFGCCLPVCAVSFKCIEELIKDGVNGNIFSNSYQLSYQLQKLLADFPHKITDLSKFKENLEKSRSLRWQENWNHTVYPLFQDLLNHH